MQATLVLVVAALLIGSAPTEVNAKATTRKPTLSPTVTAPWSFFPSASPTVFSPENDLARYSYICLQYNQSLCIGISPGPGDPYYDPNSVFLIQLKVRERNQLAGLDYKKTRWNVQFSEKIIYLSRFTDLCIAQPFQGKHVYMKSLGLYPCSNLTNNGLQPNRGLWDLSFQNNVNAQGALRLYGTDLCVTVMNCGYKNNAFCDPTVKTPANPTNAGIDPGSYLQAYQCYDSPGGDPSLAPIQTFVQKLDCAPGCPPYLQENDVCDLPCANYACNLDNGHCISAAPTPPTPGPSSSPVASPTHRPTTTNEPTTLQPTPFPTTKRPTFRPSEGPTAFPSSFPSKYPTKFPTRLPSRSPSQNPTSSPVTSQPTHMPVAKPTPHPTAQPTQAPRALPVVGTSMPITPKSNTGVIVAVVVPLFLLFLLCCVVLLVARARRKRQANDPSNWNSPVGMNQDAYEAWKNQQIPWYHRATCLLFYTRKAINVNGWAPEGEDSFSDRAKNAMGVKKPKLVGA